jgi:hypothetical protein
VTGRRWVSLVMCAAIAAPGCEGHHGPRAPATTARVAAIAGASRSATGPPPPIRTHPRIVLRADLAERPAGWTPVASIPFGPADAQLGVVTGVRHAAVPILPASFAVSGDGSLWILDVVKARIAHFAPGGRYLGAITGLEADRYHPHPRDVAIVGGRLFVLQLDPIVDLHAQIVTASEGVPLGVHALTAGGRPIVVQDLVAGATALTGWVGGFAGSDPGLLGTGPRGYARLDPVRGTIGPVDDGLEVAAGRRIALSVPSSEVMEVSFASAEERSRRAFRVDLVAPDGASIPSLAGPDPSSVVHHGIVAYVPVVPARSGDAQRYGGGRWLFRITDDGEPLLWERLPDPTIADEQQVRHLTVGPEGSIYLMVATGDGMEIYRR